MTTARQGSSFPPPLRMGAVLHPSAQMVGISRTDTMHNPADAEELAAVKAKKDAYRRDLEAQVKEGCLVFGWR